MKSDHTEPSTAPSVHGFSPGFAALGLAHNIKTPEMLPEREGLRLVASADSGGWVTGAALR